MENKSWWYDSKYSKLKEYERRVIEKCTPVYFFITVTNKKHYELQCPVKSKTNSFTQIIIFVSNQTATFLYFSYNIKYSVSFLRYIALSYYTREHECMEMEYCIIYSGIVHVMLCRKSKQIS